MLDFSKWLKQSYLSAMRGSGGAYYARVSRIGWSILVLINWLLFFNKHLSNYMPGNFVSFTSEIKNPKFQFKI
jgi:hypothetical protein